MRKNTRPLTPEEERFYAGFTPWRSTTVRSLKNKDERVKLKIATALANARGARRGVPPITNILELLSPALRTELLEESQAVIEALAEDLGDKP